MADLRAAMGLTGGPANPWALAENRSSRMGFLGSMGLRALMGLIDTPRQVFEASDEAKAGGAYNPAPVMNAAGMMAGARFPFVGPGEAGIFGGRLAATADRAMLARAEDMAAKGASRDQIWKHTGWFQGVDGKWRFEIPDRLSTMKGAGTTSEVTAKQGDTVGAAFFHPELYAAYPELAGIELQGSHVRRAGAAYSRADPLSDTGPMIRVGNDVKDPRRSLLHELQHGAQEIEGFAPGSNPYVLRPGTPAWDLYQERIKAMRTPLSREEFSRAANYDGLAPQKDYDSYLKTTRNIPANADRAAQEYAVQEAYRRYAGEVEARNVQTRMDMTPAERSAAPPWTTEDIPTWQQIVKPR